MSQMCDYVNLSEKFLLKSFDYQKQFSHFYAHRLTEMTPLLMEKVAKCWDPHIAIKQLCELHEDDTNDCIIIGTIYKQQTYKPSILKEISEQNQLAPQPLRKNYADDDDKIVLEDKLQRVRLCGDIDINRIATGVVCAVMGNLEEDGHYYVKRVAYYESGPQKTLKQNNSNVNGKFLVLISGLSYLESYNYVESLNMFQYWLVNKLQTTAQRNKVRLVIAGNSLRNNCSMSLANSSSTLLTHSGSENKDIVDGIKTLDEWFANWSSWLPVDLMPGEYDPANFMLPQQPFHRCMFPMAARHANFQNIPNPYACSIDKVLVIGSSGQNIKDILRTTTIEEPLEGLRKTLSWGHLAPTAPDTLACYPYIREDPFIIRECPHIYFVGNCEAFATDLHHGSDDQCTRLICVPSFANTQSVAIVNLCNLDCHEVSFKT